MLMSPYIVMDVVGCFVRMEAMMFCRLVLRFGSWCGRLYMLMIVCMGLFLSLLL